MTDVPHTYELRAFPHRLLRSLAGFGLAGSAMAAAVWADGAGRPWLPLLIALAAWAVAGGFAWQVLAQGYDPIAALALSPEGLTAHTREGGRTFVPWRCVQRLIAVESSRARGWAVVSEVGTIRWFGELADPEAFMAAVAEASGRAWEYEPRWPELALQ